MGGLINYIWESTFCLLFFFGIYWVFLRGEKAFHFTRFYLLITPLLALCFPLIEIPVGFDKPTISLENTAFYQNFLEPTEVEEIVGTFGLPEVTVSSTKLPTLWEFKDYLLLGYSIVVLLLLSQLIWQLFQLRMLVQKGWYQAVFKLEGNYFLIPTYGMAPIFTYFDKLFWDDTEPLSDIEQKHILQHELEHIKQRHSWDILYYQGLSIIFWFNPAIHLMRAALVDLHEYMADESVLRHTDNKESYPKLIIKIAFKGLDLPIGNYFIRSTTLKRIMMMKKRAQINWGKLLMVLPLTGMLLVLVSMKTIDPIDLFGHHTEKQTMELKERLIMAQDSIDVSMKVRKLKNPTHYEHIGPLKEGKLIAQLGELEYEFGNIDSEQEYLKLRELIETLRKDSSTEISYRKRDFEENLEVLPTPLEGEEAWFTFFANNVQKPDLENALGIGGRVEIEFIVDEKGHILDPMIRKSFGGGLDEAVIAAIMNPEAPKWKPGEKNGVAVRGLAGMRLEFTEQSQMAGAFRNIYPLLPGSKQLIAVDQSGRPVEIYDVVENMPNPPGGMEGWNAFIKENLRYPEKAKEMGIEGTVYLTFVVEKSGEIGDLGVLRGIGGGADEEAMRVVQSSPKWTPGSQRGRDVAVRIRLPVRFQLPQKENTTEKFAEWMQIADRASGQIQPTPEFFDHLRKSLKYPQEAREKIETGTVLVQLDLGKDGKIENYQIVSGVSKILDQEVLDKLANAPNWNAPKGNKPVSDLLAVTFKLDGHAFQEIHNVAQHEVKVVGYGNAEKDRDPPTLGDKIQKEKVQPATTYYGFANNLELQSSNYKIGKPVNAGFSEGNWAGLDSVKPKPLFVIDGQVVSEDYLGKIDPNNIDHIEVIKGGRALSLYGNAAKDGVILIELKEGYDLDGSVKSFKPSDHYVQIIDAEKSITPDDLQKGEVKISNKDGSFVKPLYVVDGKIIKEAELKSISPDTIESINVLKGENATKAYGKKGSNGVVEITLKK
ncbi:M56 family metallopeptidase [Pararhodonellum marinum]|uniref:M56 family metallopeptidase n=1 Tax=Pararhodonellum marinum TaxID=2755358 RepID=UPI00188FD57C|nr:M56 family metallopeptidase [Pararhodonellum marinum]